MAVPAIAVDSSDINSSSNQDIEKIDGKRDFERNEKPKRMGKDFSKIQYSILILIPFLLPVYIWWNNEYELSKFFSR